MIYHGFYGQTMAVKNVADTAVNGKLLLALRNPSGKFHFHAHIGAIVYGQSELENNSGPCLSTL